MIMDSWKYFKISSDKKALSDLKVWIESQQKISKDASYTAHLILALDRMKKPEDAKPAILHEEIPPGSPIGSDWEE
jgi:uncharacterized protein YpbB